MHRDTLKFASLCAALLSLAACSQTESHTPASQVAAKVNGAEISVHQINNVLARASGVTNDNAAQAKAEILDKLIDQQLAVEQSVTKKLDRTPNVMQAIEAAKRDILARAYLEQVASAQPKPSAEEVRKFYGEHPELFAQRRVYNLQELAIPANGPAAEEIKQLVAGSKSMQEIAAALRTKNIPFRANAGVSTAEQLPLEVLPKFHAMKDGETSIIQGPQALLIVHLVASQAQPIAEADAMARIEQFLANKHNADVIAREMKTLRDNAKIEKLGEFAAAPSSAGVAPAPKPPVASAAPAPESSGPVDDKSLAKGVAGLK